MRSLDSDEIEAQLDQDRAALQVSLLALQERLSFDALWSDGVTLAKAKIAPLGKAVSGAVLSNPLAVALTASGLGWLRSGHKSKADARVPRLDARIRAVSRWEDDGGHIAGPSASDFDWIDKADALCARAAGMLAQINTASRSGKVSARVLQDSRADVMAALTKDVRRIMTQGLQDLEHDARDRALAKREHAYDLHHRAQNGSSWYNGTFANAALSAVGAIVTALMPQHESDNARTVMSSDQNSTPARRDERDR